MTRMVEPKIFAQQSPMVILDIFSRKFSQNVLNTLNIWQGYIFLPIRGQMGREKKSAFEKEGKKSRMKKEEKRKKGKGNRERGKKGRKRGKKERKRGKKERKRGKK